MSDKTKQLNKEIIIAAAIVLVIAALTLLSGCGLNLSQNKPEPASRNSAGQTAPAPGFKSYSHPGYGFSFDYPDGWNVSSFAENDGETVLLQNLSASDLRIDPRNISGQERGGIQIYILMFDEPGPITKERILQDIPDLIINNDKQIKIAGVADGLKFDSASQSGEKTKEVWFVYENFLYQMTAIEGSGDVLDKIVRSWKYR